MTERPDRERFHFLQKLKEFHHETSSVPTGSIAIESTCKPGSHKVILQVKWWVNLALIRGGLLKVYSSMNILVVTALLVGDFIWVNDLDRVPCDVMYYTRRIVPSTNKRLFVDGRFLRAGRKGHFYKHKNRVRWPRLCVSLATAPVCFIGDIIRVNDLDRVPCDVMLKLKFKNLELPSVTT